MPDPELRFKRRADEFTASTWGDARHHDGLQSLADGGAHPLRIVEQALGQCLDALAALEAVVPADKLDRDTMSLINACGTCLSLSRSELHTTLAAEALAYAAGGPDAA